MQVVDLLATGTAQGVKQDPTQVTKAPKMTKEHGAIDWRRTAAEVCNHVRAMQPWPTPYTFWHRPGQQPVRVIVLKGMARTGAEAAAAGTILVQSDLSKLSVVAGDGGIVDITELQPAGKKRMNAAEFLRGRRPQPGDRLGPET